MKPDKTLLHLPLIIFLNNNACNISHWTLKYMYKVAIILLLYLDIEIAIIQIVYPSAKKGDSSK